MDDATVASWVLLAVGAMNGTNALLDRVIAAADSINHAVLLHGELELAVQILEGSGLVSASGSTLRLTDAGRSELKLAESRYWDESWIKLRNRIEGLGITSRSSWHIDPAHFTAAVDAYLGRRSPKRKR